MDLSQFASLLREIVVFGTLLFIDYNAMESNMAFKIESLRLYTMLWSLRKKQCTIIASYDNMSLNKSGHYTYKKY